MKKFEIRHADGTVVIVKATNEDMARQFAMTKKWGDPQSNKTWPTDYWEGRGLLVKELADEA